jgi:hypothetical protein
MGMRISSRRLATLRSAASNLALPLGLLLASCAQLVGCGGATHVQTLGSGVPLERGALGPFTVTLTLLPRDGRSLDACRPALEEGLDARRAHQLAEYRVASADQIGWVALYRDAAQQRLSPTRAGAVVHRFDAPVVLDNELERSGREVVVLVLSPLPWFRPRGIIEQRMVERASEYVGLGGLLRKYFVLSTDDRVGGLYLWHDSESAAAHFDDAWLSRTTERYGRAPEVTRFEVIGVDTSGAFSSLTEEAGR